MSQKICTECNKKYDYCFTCEEGFAKGLFAWRTVCCSYECAKNYFKKLETENKEIKEISKNIETKGATKMQILLDNGKTYDVEKIDTKKGTIKVFGIDNVITSESIKEIMFLTKEDVVNLAKIFENSKKSE